MNLAARSLAFEVPSDGRQSPTALAVVIGGALGLLFGRPMM